LGKPLGVLKGRIKAWFGGGQSPIKNEPISVPPSVKKKQKKPKKPKEVEEELPEKEISKDIR
jgi:hypothetical protein